MVGLGEAAETVSDTIRIEDLARPVLSQEQKGAIAYGKTLTLDFSRQSVLAEARERTGLSDFGSDDFHERLDLLLDEWGRDAELTGIGKLSLRNKLVTFAANRLLIEAYLSEHPEVDGSEVLGPIIVIGLPRSGTTHMLNLLASDRRLRSLPLWESYEPLPLPDQPATGGPEDPRYQRCAYGWEMMQRMTPHLAAMHPMDPEHIHEELELMGPDFASYNFEWLAMSPRWRDHYYAHDQGPHYRYMKRVLGILQARDGAAPAGGLAPRWVLKCPQHLEQIPVLTEVFPDATVVVTHRDPVAVIRSTVTMLAYGQRVNRRSVDCRGLIEYWSDRIEHLLGACVRDRDLLPQDRSIDVPFDRFMADDMGTVARIYQKAGLDLGDEARGVMTDFIDRHPRGKHGRVVYDLEGDFGVSAAELRSRFDFYFERFEVAVED